MAAYITDTAEVVEADGGNIDFIGLPDAYHSDEDNNYDYVDKWLNDCLKEDMPVAEQIEPLAEWDRQYCDRNALVSLQTILLSNFNNYN